MEKLKVDKFLLDFNNEDIKEAVENDLIKAHKNKFEAEIQTYIQAQKNKEELIVKEWVTMNMDKIKEKTNVYSIDDIIERLNSVERLEKALDKACDELESLDYKLKMKEALPCSYDCDYINAEEWKKELLK